MVKKSEKPRVVILGGGNGTSQLLRSLLPLLDDASISSLHALVQMADDGGSTGRLRDQYGVAAMGDLTKCLMALSSFHGDVRGDEFLKALEYRFINGDFQGHTLRNIFLTALELTSEPNAIKQRGTSIDTAIATMARILQIPKAAGVVPTTLTTLTEQVVIEHNGKSNLLGDGQHSISHRVNLQADPGWKPGDVRVQFSERGIKLNPRARAVLKAADYVVVAPGHTYGTILPTLAVPALGKVTAKSTAKFVVVTTLLTTPLQTEGWGGEDFVRVYESYLGRGVDTVLSNKRAIRMKLVPGQSWVRFLQDDHTYDLKEVDLVNRELPKAQAGDSVPRAIVVHDVHKMENQFRALFKR